MRLQNILRSNKIIIILIYLLLVAFAINFTLKPTTFSVVSVFFLCLIVPGISIIRLIGLKLKKNILDQFIMSCILGFIAVLLICFISILIGLNINQLIIFYILFTLIGVIATLYFKTPKHNKKTDFRFNIKNYLTQQNFTSIFLLIFCFILLFGIYLRGSDFEGDPKYHLSIVRKAYEGGDLTVYNLLNVKNQISIAYVFPIWHIFIAFFSKISNTNIFTAWSELSFCLSIFMIVTWYWLLNIIFRNRYLVVIGLVIFIGSIFAENGYIFSRMAVPDTLSALILLPVIIGLSLQYILKSDNNIKDVFIILTMALLMAMIHFTQYFYYIFALFFFGLLFIITRFKDKDYKLIIKKWLSINGFIIIILILFLVFLESINNLVSTNFKMYFNQISFEKRIYLNDLNLFTRIGYMVMPLCLFFLKKYRALIIVLATQLIMLLTHSVTLDFVGYWLARFLTHIFIDRLSDNLNWIFIIWTLIIYSLIMVIDRLFTGKHSNSNYIQNIITYGLLFLSVCIFVIEIYFHQFTILSSQLFGPYQNKWINTNYFYITILLLISIIYSFKLIKSKSYNILFNEPKNHIVVVILIIILSQLIAMPVYANNKNNLTNVNSYKLFFSSVEDKTERAVLIKEIGNDKNLDFIKNEIPSKSILYSNRGYYEIALLTDNYLPSFAKRGDKIFNLIFRDETGFSHEKKIQCLNSGHIDYLILIFDKEIVIEDYFAFPRYFESVYKENDINIFKINYNKAGEDGIDLNDKNIICSNARND